jgi:hypothetical protein
MKPSAQEVLTPPSSTAPVPVADPFQRDSEPPARRGPIEFRFVLRFGAQLSTPCSRAVEAKHEADHLLVRPAPRMFQSYLRRHGVLE